MRMMLCLLLLALLRAVDPKVAAIHLEKLALRQQLAVFKKKRPRLWPRRRDRLFWVLLATIWLAWPQLDALKDRLPTIVLGCLLALLLVVAVRPRIFPIAAGILLATVIINGAIRRLSGKKVS